MKKSLNILLVVTIGVSLIFTSCKKDENDLPVFTKVELSNDNATLTVTFSEPVYANSDATGNLDATDLNVTINAAAAVQASYNVAHTAGESTVVISLEYASSLAGDETITVGPADGASIYDADGDAMEAAEKITTDPLAASYYGIVGEWEAYDVSAVLLSLGYDDSLYVKFNDDQSYEVTSFIAGITYTIKGTYTQAKSDNGDIWTITANQTELNGTPYEVTSEGIFQVFTASPDSMWYEIAQTNPAIAGVTAPTAAAGFGSTSGGAFGLTNIQKYIRKD